MAIQLTLTEYGNKLILQQGVFTTFKKFGVTDDGNRYDVTAPPDLTDKFYGGLRTLVTTAPTCAYATSKPISKDKLTDEQKKMSTRKLEWEIARLDDCSTTYTATNPKILVNLRTWFNYLKSKEGSENYNYSDKLQLSLTDNIKAIQKELNPSTYEYEQVADFDDLNISYKLDNSTSYNNYKNANAYVMTTQRGQKVLSTTTDNRWWSPFLIYADTEQGQNGSGDNWKMSLNVASWGYAGILANSTDTTFRKNNFYTISQIENMTADEVNNKFRSLRPAAITSKTNSNNDIYVLEDLLGTYSEGIDMLPTYTQRFKNSNGDYLSTGLINKAVNFIQTNFTESTTTPGLYQNVITMRVNNRTVNGVTYTEDNQVVGGNIEIILQWDNSSTDTDYDNIVTWI